MTEEADAKKAELKERKKKEKGLKKTVRSLARTLATQEAAITNPKK